MVLIKLYLLLIILVVMHELAHFLSLRIFKIKIYSFVLGSLIYYKYKFYKISPFIMSGYITYDKKQFNQLFLFKKIIIVLSGVFVNYIIYLIIPDSFVLYKFVTKLYLIFILLPLPFLNTDTYILFKIIFEKIK